MNKQKFWVRLGLTSGLLIGLSFALLHGHNFAILNSKGPIARDERSLMLTALALSLIVVLPVFTLLFTFAWKYREGNAKNAQYLPEWDGNRIAETIWWIIPSALIIGLGVITWQSTHRLDPIRPISSNHQTMTIQVIALQWRWLFLYPAEHVASLNSLQLPTNTDVDFEITSDAPMNSFWIPQLGGQIYAMPGMTTHLHLLADHVGNYQGRSANISGKGFAQMTFTAKATSQATFDKWVKQTKRSNDSLNFSSYSKVSQPSEDHVVRTYGHLQDNLYTAVVQKYMAPGNNAGLGVAE